METNFSNITGMFKTNNDIVTKAVGEVAPEHWFTKPGDDSNHFMWVLGHLIWSRGNVIKLLGGQWENPYAPQFARGAKLTDREEYPSVEAMRIAWDEVSAKLTAALANVTPEGLSKVAPQGPPSFDGKVSGAVSFLAFHETYHVGQVSYLRKWLGYGQSVG